MTRQDIIRIGTRGSPLALAQAHETRDRLIAAHHDLTPDHIEIVPVSTKGDRIQDRALSEIGGKGLFTEEIEAGLLDGSLDMAVHSMKDMPTELPEGLIIPCILPREEPFDALITSKATSLMDLPEGGLVGTASLRRKAQLLHVRPDLRVTTFRGNIQTRMQKLADGEVDATFLAIAGLNRMDRQDVITARLDGPEMIPACAQGAIGVEISTNNARAAELLDPLNDVDSFDCVTLERAFLHGLDGSCRTPIAGLAVIDPDDETRLVFRGRIVMPDGTDMLETAIEGPRSEARELGEQAAQAIREQAGAGFSRFMEEAAG